MRLPYLRCLVIICVLITISTLATASLVATIGNPFNEDKSTFHTHSIQTLTTDEQYIYSGALDGSLRIWDKNSQKLINKLITGRSEIRSISLDENHIYAAAGNIIYVWDKYTLEVIKQISGHKANIQSITLDEKYLYSSGWNKAVYVWDKETFSLIKTLEGHEDVIWSLHTDESYIYGASTDNNIYLWKKSFSFYGTLRGHKDVVYSVITEKNKLYTASNAGKLFIWEKNSFDSDTSLNSDYGGILDLELDENYIYASTTLGKLFIWEKEQTSSKPIIISAHEKKINAISIDDQHIYTCSDDKTIRVWKKPSKTQATPFASSSSHSTMNPTIRPQSIPKEYTQDHLTQKLDVTHKGTNIDLGTVHVDNDYVYLAGIDSALYIYDKESLEQIKRISFHSMPITDITSDKKYIYTVSEDQSMQIVDKNIFTLQQQFKDAHRSVISNVFIDQSQIYTSSWDKTVNIWNKNNYLLMKTLTPHNRRIFSIHVDKGFIFTASEDKTVAINYHHKNRGYMRVGQLRDHSAPVEKVFSDHAYIYTFTKDGIIHIWEKNILTDHIEQHIDTLLPTDTKVKIITLPSKRKLSNFPVPVKTIYVDLNYLYIGFTDGSVSVLEKQDFTTLFHERSESGSITDISSDSLSFYVTTDEGRLSVWSKPVIENACGVSIQRISQSIEHVDTIIEELTEASLHAYAMKEFYRVKPDDVSHNQWDILYGEFNTAINQAKNINTFLEEYGKYDACGFKKELINKIKGLTEKINYLFSQTVSAW